MNTQEQNRTAHRQNKTKPRIAVLALQGDFARHVDMLQRLGAEAYPARLPKEVQSADGIVLPGGESTTIGKLMTRYGLDEALQNAAQAQTPIYGTCAGMILLARQIAAGTGERGGQPTLGLLDITVARNGFGRQQDSFEAGIDVSVLGEEPLRAVFIRAPYVTETGADVETLAAYEGKVVFVRQGNILGSAFHPELTPDDRVHRFFLSLVTKD